MTETETKTGPSAFSQTIESIPSHFDFDLDIVKVIQDLIKNYCTRDAHLHVHKDGEVGASSLGKCKYQLAVKHSDEGLPPREGLQAKYGRMNVGTIWHEIIQGMLISYFRNHPPGEHIHFIDEVYTKTSIISGKLDGLSPIDLAFIYAPPGVPPVIEIDYEFADGKIEEIPIKNPDERVKWVYILDIKTSSQFSYWKYKNEGLSFAYQAQMLFYLKGTGLPAMDVLFVQKGSTDHMFMLTQEWDDALWKRVVKRHERILAITETLNSESDTSIELKDEDFGYNDEDQSFLCMFCPLAQVDEYQKKTGERKLKLVAPCEPCAEKKRKIAAEKFIEGSTWYRGRSHIIINKIEGNIIHATNKGGTEFEDSIFYALQKYEVREK
jgi:hypothetical protein